MKHQSGTASPNDLFEDLYRRYYRAVHNFFIRKGCGQEQSHDLAQETFIRAYKGMSSYRGEAEWSWLLAIARRIFLNLLRYQKAEKRDVEVTSLDGMDFEPTPATWSELRSSRASEPLREVIQKESIGMLRRSLARRPDEDRQCWSLYCQGYKYKEIASLMRSTEDAVKSRLKRLRGFLEETLGEHYEDPSPRNDRGGEGE